jgi:hypothetical protein
MQQGSYTRKRLVSLNKKPTHMKNLCYLIILLLPLLAQAQNKYQINGVKVIANGSTLQNAWVGGFNNPVFSTIDLNQDGLDDLFIYDKAGWKALSFINTGSVGHPSYTYAPQYDQMYPKTLLDWALIRDYNHDGVGDIFALTSNADMAVYKGFRNGNLMTYELVDSHLHYPLGNYTDHIWTFSDNMPVLMDVDGDGAIDVLAPDINGGVNLDWYRNVAVDSGYSADSLVFVLQSQCWGHFEEDVNDCNVQLGRPCQGGHIDTTHRDLRHQGGACWGTHYVRNSPVTSVFIADIYCNTMKFLWNTGATDLANVTYVDSLFPSYDTSINLSLFPAIYGVDADNDGFEDLMVAPFASNANVPEQSIDVNVVQYYHNNAGSDSVNTYHYEGDTLFNNSIVDVGSESHPVFFDYNADSLMDIVIGEYGRFSSPGQSGASGLPGISVSSLTLYQNVGTDTMPVFQLVDTDWMHLSAYNLTGLYPAFGDLNGDGLPDMVVGDLGGYINYFQNRGTAGHPSYPAMDGPNWFNLYVGNNLNQGNDATPFIYDVNGDGLPDIVMGSSGRSPSFLGSHIFYFWNFGTPANPQFSPDSVNDFFGNITVWDYELGVVEGFSNPWITKENGQLMLYTGSQRGLTFKYLINPDSLRSGTFVTLDSDLLGINPGLRSTVSVADINHDGKNDYLTGNMRGGIMLFSDTSWSSDATNAIATVPADNSRLIVYPNPAKDKIICRLGSGGQALVSAQLYDLMGAEMGAATVQNGENGIQLNVSGVAQGIYIVRAYDGSGKAYQQKVAVIK